MTPTNKRYILIFIIILSVVTITVTARIEFKKLLNENKTLKLDRENLKAKNNELSERIESKNNQEEIIDYFNTTTSVSAAGSKLTKWSAKQHQLFSEKLKDSKFSSKTTTISEIREKLSEDQLTSLYDILNSGKCTNDKINIFYKEDIKEYLIVTECPYSNVSDYNLMIAVKEHNIYAIKNIEAFGFMYESGTLYAVSDINKDGNLELWLEGTICECDGLEENETCDCDGESVVEESEGYSFGRWARD